MSEKKQSSALVVYQQMESPSFLKELAKAIPNTLKPERMVRLALTMMRRNKALAECSAESIMSCVVETAQLGLELEGVLGHAYMVPFGGVATLIIGYRGFAHLMYQSGSVLSVSAEVVRKDDRFNFILGTERRLIHMPAPLKLREDKNGADDPEKNWLGAYAAVKMISGATEFEYMEAALIYSHRAKSRSWQKYQKEGSSTPWQEYPARIAMWCKTPIRKLAKRMPTSTSDQRANLLRAAMLDEYAEKKGLLVPTLGGFEINPDPPDDPENDPVIETELVEETLEAPAPRQEKQPKAAKTTKKAEPPADGMKPPRANLRGESREEFEHDRFGTAGPIHPKKAEPPKEDPLIDSREQTDIYSKAVATGWKVPDEVIAMLKKKFQLDSIRKVRRSQIPAIMHIIESGE